MDNNLIIKRNIGLETEISITLTSSELKAAALTLFYREAEIQSIYINNELHKDLSSDELARIAETLAIDALTIARSYIRNTSLDLINNSHKEDESHD